MATVHPQITPQLQTFIEKQRMFFVATAPLAPQGHINLSPKGVDCFRVLTPTQVAYLDLVGSGNETSAHILENGRVTFMFCSFEGEPNILRLYGTGRSVVPGQPGWEELAALFPRYPNTRQIFTAAITRVSTACGFGVPTYQYESERTGLFDWANQAQPGELDRYMQANNSISIDGLPTTLPPCSGEAGAV